MNRKHGPGKDGEELATSTFRRKGAPEFHQLMNELLQFMQIPPSRLSSDEVYCFTIDDKTEISFLQQEPGSIDMLVHAATLSNPKADDVLRKLLEMNLFTAAGPNISVGMNPKTGAISLWSRMLLAGMDVPLLVKLIQLALKRASAVLRCLRSDAVPLIPSRRKGMQFKLP
jgi:hypothetical protein